MDYRHMEDFPVESIQPAISEFVRQRWWVAKHGSDASLADRRGEAREIVGRIRKRILGVSWLMIRRRRIDAVSWLARESHDGHYSDRACLLLHHPLRVGFDHPSPLGCWAFLALFDFNGAKRHRIAPFQGRAPHSEAIHDISYCVLDEWPQRLRSY